MSVHWNEETQTDTTQVGHDSDNIYANVFINQWMGRVAFEENLAVALDQARKSAMIEYDKLSAMDTPI